VHKPLRRFIRSSLRVVVLLSGILSGCFSSEQPLLTEDDAVTPLPDTFALFEMDESGNPKTSKLGEAIVTNFARVGKVYLEKGENTTSTLTLMKLNNDSNLFLAQYVILSNEKRKDESRAVIYMIGKRLDNIIFSYAPPFAGKTGLDAALKDAGVAFTINGLKFLAFSDKTQLLAAARVFASRLEEGRVSRYRIASSKQEVAALQQEIEAGRSQNAIPKAASPGAQADGAAQRECDALAASPYDLSRPAGVSGVQFEKIDAPRAEAACRRAVQEHPSPRLYAQLGRALNAGRKYADAVANYRIAADQRSPLGQHGLGTMYEHGESVARDAVQAVFWYGKAAEQDYAPSQDNLGALYANGDGVRKDIAQAMALFRKAAEQGFVNSELNLGRMYDETKAFAQAAVWYRKAAEHGDIEAANNLGSLYYNGLGVPENNQEAIFWFKKAAAAGNAMAQRNLDRVAEDQRRARAANAPSNSEYERTKQDIEQSQRLRCGNYQMSGNRVGMSTIPGCY
jgi:TPR repeat protein